MADLNRKAIFDLAEIELLAKINNWKMNTCGIPPENKIDLWIKESQCRRSQLLPKLIILSKMLRILKRDICQEYVIKMELNDQVSLMFLWIPTFYCALCHSSFHVISWSASFLFCGCYLWTVSHYWKAWNKEVFIFEASLETDVDKSLSITMEELVIGRLPGF